MSGLDRPFECDDPLALVPVVLEVPAEDGSCERMARALVEEYMMLGCSDARIAELFRNPFYRATHDILRRKGEAYVLELIEEVRNG